LVVEEPTRWIDDLPPELARHAVILRSLLTEAQSDGRIRIVAVGCSIGRGVADHLSDIDAYIAIQPDRWERYLDEVPLMLTRLGGLLDMSHKRIEPSDGEPYQLTWALYEDVSLELVVAPAQQMMRPGSDWVVLHDPDQRVGERRPERYATAENVREWAYDGWSLLLLCAKYLSRQSLWEAIETLHLARTRVWRVWAAARHIQDPQYGLTAVLDSTDPTPPEGIENTHAPLDRDALARAALASANLLNKLWPEAMAAVTGQAQPVPKAGDIARRKLHELVP
jgi:hypothetical protein